MAKWKCDCGYSRELRSDGIAEACSACGAPEHDALREAIGVPEEPKEFEASSELNEVIIMLPNIKP